MMHVDQQQQRVLFEAVSRAKGLFYKNLFDLHLQISPLCDKNPRIRQTCFKIRNNGLQIYTNVQHHIHANAKVTKEAFDTYTLTGDVEELNIGISLEYLKTTFKNAKKTDDVVFTVLSDDTDDTLPGNICIQIIKTQKTSKNSQTNDYPKVKSNAKIKVTLVQNQLLEFGERITDPVNVSNEEYLSICRNIQMQPGWIDIARSEQSLKFAFQVNEIIECSTIIGEASEPLSPPQRFNANNIKSTNKIATFGPQLKIYLNKHQPMVIESNNEHINIGIWVKSNDQISEENK
jgi:hypothetical protein